MTTEKLEKNKGAHCAIYKTGKIFMYYKNHKFLAPIEALDFASLYPFIIITHNLSKEKMSFDKIENYDCDEEYFNEYLKHFNKLKEEIQSVLNIIDTSKLEKSYKDTFIYQLEHLANEDNFGIIPKFLYSLYKARVIIKAKLKNVEKKCEDLLEQFKLKYTINDFIKEFNPTEELADKQYGDYCKKQIESTNEYKLLLTEKDRLNAEQLAIKITMNGTYGYVDSKFGLYYEPIIPALVTYYGRKYINAVNYYCIKEGKTVVYNDTDSVYFHHNVEDFADILDRYINKEFDNETLNKKLVMRSIRLNTSHKEEVERLTKKYQDKPKILEEKLNRLGDSSFYDRINNHIHKLSGYCYLMLAREETLYPAIYLMKKKYLGKIHVNAYKGKDYTFDNLLLKGIELVKGNAIKFITENMKSMISRIIDTNEEIDIIVYDTLNALYNLSEEYINKNLDLFIKVVKYKSDAKNAAYRISEVYDIKRELYKDEYEKNFYKKFSHLEPVYFIIIKQFKYLDLLGRNYKSNYCELSEKKESVQYFNYKVDLHHYIDLFLNCCAQFLTYKTDFTSYHENIEVKNYKEIIKNVLKKEHKNKVKETNKNKLLIQKNIYKKYKNEILLDLNSELNDKYPDISWILRLMFNVPSKYFVLLEKTIFKLANKNKDTNRYYDNNIYELCKNSYFNYSAIFNELECYIEKYYILIEKKLFNIVGYLMSEKDKNYIHYINYPEINDLSGEFQLSSNEYNFLSGLNIFLTNYINIYSLYLSYSDLYTKNNKIKLNQLS